MFVAPEDVDEAAVVGRGRHVGEIEVDELALLVDEGAGRGHALSPTATLVWRCLDATAPLADVIEDLADVFEAPREEIATDVISLVQNLGALGLIDGVLQSIDTMPIDIEFVDEDDCTDPPAGQAPAPPPSFDSRYLAVPPNT